MFGAVGTIPLLIYIMSNACTANMKSHREQIGSVKGPKNFSSDQTVFHRDDVPAARRERKKEVKEVIAIAIPSRRADIL